MCNKSKYLLLQVMECAERKEVPDVSLPDEEDLNRPRPQLIKVKSFPPPALTIGSYYELIYVERF